MRNVLIVFGLAAAAIIISIALQRPKDLSPAPQDIQNDRKEAEIKAEQAKMTKQKPADPPEIAAVKAGALTAVLTVEGRGDITFEVFPKAAPNTVAHFVDLVRKGFYDGVKFDTAVKGSILQAGDPESRKYPAAEVANPTPEQKDQMNLGTHGSGKGVVFESNDLRNVTGTIGLALPEPRSNAGDSEFYINLSDKPGMDGDYCVFGRIVSGLDIANAVQQGDVISKFVIR